MSQTQSPTLQIPLVGMGFRPPAKAILACLPAGAKFTLEPQPDNEYDAGAVKVHVASTEIPESSHQELALHLAGYGLTVEEFLAQPSWWLGFLCQKMPKGVEGYDTNEGVAERLMAEEKEEWDGSYSATLTFMPSGAPLILLTWANQAST